jgi:hypothetical protein
MVRDLAVRAGNRAKLEMIERVPALHRLIQRQHEDQLRQYEPFARQLPPEAERMVDGVREVGVHVSSLDELALPGTPQLKAGLETLSEALRRRAATMADETARPSLEDLLAESAVWQWGLNEPLLDLAELYLGLPARYYGADLRMERATARAVGVRQWHRDVEDHRMFKILVWINDVDVDGGPFEYVPRSHTELLARQFRYVSGFVSDEDLARVVPRSDWRQATGPTWTAVLSDTRSVFHRAMPPVARDRFSVTFTFTSRTPLTTLPTPRLTAAQRELATQGLTDRQRASLLPAFLA